GGDSEVEATSRRQCHHLNVELLGGQNRGQGPRRQSAAGAHERGLLGEHPNQTAGLCDRGLADVAARGSPLARPPPVCADARARAWCWSRRAGRLACTPPSCATTASTTP